MAVLGGHGRAHHIGGGADGRGAAAQVRAHRQRPGQHMQVHALGLSHGLNHRHHGSGKGDVVHKGAGHGGHPQDDGHHHHGLAAAEPGNAVCQHGQAAGALQPGHHHEQAVKNSRV